MQRLENLKSRLEIAMAYIPRERKRLGKAEGKIQKLTLGYQKRAETLKKDVMSLMDEIVRV